jgi:hypothetical protein
MNFFKENPFLSGLIVVAVIVLGGLGFLLSQSLSEYSLQKENLDARIAELHRLQNASPYPSEENVAATRAIAQETREALLALEAQARSLLPEVPADITPQQFQDDLRRVVSSVVEKAAEAKVTLPEGFYLGFDEFRTALPDPIQAPFLARQLAVNTWLVNAIIESGVSQIDVFTRNELPIEKSLDAATFPENPEPADIIRTNTLVLSLTGEQGRVRRALNDVIKAPQFLIIRAIEMSNSSQDGPSRVDTPVEATTAASPTLESLFGQENTEGQRTGEDLPIVLGKETVTARMNLQFLDFAPLNLN